MANVFNFTQDVKGAFRADKLKVTFRDDVSGMLCQNIQFSFTQQVSFLYEIGSSYVYYVGGRAQGNATIARIVGPAGMTTKFLTTYGDICADLQDIVFKATPSCKGVMTGTNYKLKKVVLTGLSASVAAQDIVIHEQGQFMFADMEVT